MANGSNTDPSTIQIGDNHLSIGMGKMSFVQYGFEHDPGRGKKSFFDPDRVVLLVLNNSSSVLYEFEDDEGRKISAVPPAISRDQVVILWPREEGAPPDALSPEKIFEYSVHLPDGRGRKKWPRESFDAGGRKEDWDTALVFRDPHLNYVYEYRGEGDGDHYLFALQGLDLKPWVWRKGEDSPHPLFEDESSRLKRAFEARAGGPQQTDGALPYPPK